MIYTITTNPSLDYTVECDLVPGRVNRTRSEAIYPGGKGINVSVILQRLGMETMALGFAAGKTDAVMDKLSQVYETEMDDRIGHLVSLIEPTLVTVLSLIIGAILLAVMLPLASILTTIA